MKTLKLVKSDTYLRPYAEAIEGRYNYALKREKELTGGKKLSEWANGYMYFGLHKVEGEVSKVESRKLKVKSKWVLREWAPNATAIYMIGDFNNWQKDEAYRLQPVGNGVWEVMLDEYHSWISAHNSLQRHRIASTNAFTQTWVLQTKCNNIVCSRTCKNIT